MPRARKPKTEYIDLTEDSPGAGPSSRPQPPNLTNDKVETSSKSKPKRKRAGDGGEASCKKKAKAKPEKRVDAAGRTVRWSSSPSVKIIERIQRAMPGSGHRLFLIDRKMLSPVGSEGGAVEEFAVLGATGNVYTVTVCRQPQCTCPDFLRGNLCKHILFTMLRVLRLPRDEPLVWQRALLTDEVDAVLGGKKSTRLAGPGAVTGGALGAGDVLADEAVRAHYRQLEGGGAGASGSGQAGCSQEADGGRKPVEGDCPICFDPLQPGATKEEDKVTFCAGGCGNNVHVGCMRLWTSQHQPPTCPLCRAPWVDGLHPSTAGQPKQYANLAQYSHQHQECDTSLEALYGDRALWIRSHQGEMGRGMAANLWRGVRGR